MTVRENCAGLNHVAERREWLDYDQANGEFMQVFT